MAVLLQRLSNLQFECAVHAMTTVWLNPTSWLAFLVRACSTVMAVRRYQPKLVYRSPRVKHAGRRKLVTWSEYWLRVLPASSALARHGKPGRRVWTDLVFSKRTYKQRASADAKFTERSQKLTPVARLWNPVRLDAQMSLTLCTCTLAFSGLV